MSLENREKKSAIAGDHRLSLLTHQQPFQQSKRRLAAKLAQHKRLARELSTSIAF
jgi:hypothetical protein